MVGPATAPITIVVYMDFQCSYCRAALQVLRQRVARDENVRLLFKHHPLASHEWSRVAARHGLCLYKQSNDLFWRFSDFVFQRQADITADSFGSQIEEFFRSTPEVNQEAFRSCIRSPEPARAILLDENSAYVTGVNATPTLFVDGKKIVGMGEEADFLQLIDRREAVVKNTR
jgi:protein-disulfide isomerase